LNFGHICLPLRISVFSDIMKRLPLWGLILSMLAVAGIVLGISFFKSSSPRQASPSELSQGSVIDGHQAVDLGLSVKWAACNIGASAPECQGKFFIGKAHGWIEAPSQRSSVNELSKVMPASKWSGRWRPATWNEAVELCEKCNWQWVSVNGVDGCKVTGPNGNSIFLPAAGYGYSNGVKGQGREGHYWLAADASTYPSCIYFDCNSHLATYSFGFYLSLVRLVIP
jgi:hypothetical protein